MDLALGRLSLSDGSRSQTALALGRLSLSDGSRSRTALGRLSQDEEPPRSLPPLRRRFRSCGATAEALPRLLQGRGRH